MFPAEKLADAAMQISVVYELVFGKGFISRHLKVLEFQEGKTIFSF